MKFRWIWLIVLLIVFAVGFNSVFYPAYMSTRFACSPENQTTLEERTGYKEVGSFDVVSNGTEMVETITVQYDYPDRRIAKHERIHQVQYRQKRLFVCPLNYVNEIEAYAGQRLGDRAFERVYGGLFELG